MKTAIDKITETSTHDSVIAKEKYFNSRLVELLNMNMKKARDSRVAVATRGL